MFTQQMTYLINAMRHELRRVNARATLVLASGVFSFLEHESHKYHEYLHAQACAGQDSRWLNVDDNEKAAVQLRRR